MTILSTDTATLYHWLAQGEALLIDVREPAEHAAQKIGGAVSIPLSTISAAALPTRQGTRLVLHCQRGGRSLQACQKLIAQDSSLTLHNLEGGINAWAQANLPVITAKRRFLSIDRQVQLIIGTGVLLGSGLAFFVSPWFVLLSGFFGAGLTFAGLSGTCGLAVLLAKLQAPKKSALQAAVSGSSCTFAGEKSKA